MRLVQRRLLGLLILVALGALGLWLALWQHGATERKAERERQEEKVLALEDGTRVHSLTLKTPSGAFAAARGEGNTWQLTSPLQTAADGAAIDAMLGHLAGLSRTREVGAPRDDGSVEPPEDLSPFGLAPPRFEVKLADEAGTSETLLVGKKSRFDGSMFVQKAGQPVVGLVPGALEYQVDKDLFALREKRLAVLESDDIHGVVVDAKGKGNDYTLERRQKGFWITAPREMLADSTQITGILSALSALRAKRFVSEKPEARELKDHGLTPPEARVELAFGSEREPVTFLFGETLSADGEPEYFATREGDHPLIELSSDWALRKLLVGVDALRDKHVLRFERDAVSRITLRKGEMVLELEKRAAEGEGRTTWHIVQPESRKAQASMVAALLYRLWNLKARRIEAEAADDARLKEAGLDAPEIEVSLFGEGGAEIGSLLFGRKIGSERYATARGSGRIDLVSDGPVSETSFDVGDYTDFEAQD